MAVSTTRKARFQVALQHCNRQTRFAQDLLGLLEEIFASLDDSALLARLQEYRPTGRQGYPLKALWRAYVGSFVLTWISQIDPSGDWRSCDYYEYSDY